MLNDFISLIKTKGLARINRYDVMITFPNPGADIKQIATLFCDSVNLPGSNIATSPMRTYGEIREMPYEKMYDSITFSFYVDSDLQIKKAFEDWQDLIVDPDSRTLGYYEDYITDIDIFVRNVDDSVPYKVTLFECYPKTLNSIQLDTAGREVMKMTVVMQYKYWRSEQIKQSGLTTDQISGPPPSPPQGSNTGSGYSYGNGYSMLDQGPRKSYSFDPPQSVIRTGP